MTNDATTAPDGHPEDADEGLLQRVMRKLLGRSWQTSLAGLAALGGSATTAIATVADAPLVMKWAPIVSSALVALGVMLSKGQNVSGPSK